MATAAQVSGEGRIFDTVVQYVNADIIFRIFGMGRDALSAMIARGATDGMVEKAWEALISDPQLVSIPQHLLAIASREEIAKDLAAVLARSPYYGSTTAKATALAHRVTANTMVTRASYYQFEKASMERVSRLMAEALTTIDAAAGRMIQRTIARLSKASPGEQNRILSQVAAGTSAEAREFMARMDSALLSWRGSFVKSIVEDAKNGRRQGFQRAIDTLYHFEDARNPWSRLAHPLSSFEMGSIFFNHRHQVLPIAEARVLVEARGLHREIREGISKIITREVFLKGENPKKAAAEILKRYKAALGERWGGSKVSALRIARTETSYILNEATRVAYAEAGVRYVDVVYTEGAYPCDICPPIAEGGPYEMDHVPEGGIPFHPNCRCTYTAAFPKASVEDLKPPAKVFGAKTWATELAKYGFIATAASRLFGTDKPTAEDRKSVEEVIDSVEDLTAEASVDREVANRYHSVTGYRRIEPDRFPKPMTDRLQEVTIKDPVRAIYDLRKNSYEIGGVIRGNRILYYRGDGHSVGLGPVMEGAGGIVKGDILFHTHPTSLRGWMSGSMPSHQDLLMHLRVTCTLGDGARHVISGADGLREIRSEVKDIEKWKRAVTEHGFLIYIVLVSEVMRGSNWWTTYGIRKAIKNLEYFDMGGTLVVSEPTTPGSDFIPLKPYVSAMNVHPAIAADLERRTNLQLRDLYTEVAEAQGASVFRDRDYYIGILRSIDPSRDWDEAAPTKTIAADLLREQGLAATGTWFSKEEIIAHLTGQPVAGKVYIDTSKIDYVKLLGISKESAMPPLPAPEEWYIGGQLSDDEVEELFQYVAVNHGVPVARNRQVKVAAMEHYDPRGSYLVMSPPELEARLREVDVSHFAEHPSEEQLKTMPPSVRKKFEKQIADGEDMDTWTIQQKRDIISGVPVHGIVFIPDRTIVWWGSMLEGFPSSPPDVGPTISRTSKEKHWVGRDDHRSGVLYSNRQETFKERWGITLREEPGTSPWLPAELALLDYALHLIPGAASFIQSASRVVGARTGYLDILERLVVGDGATLPVLIFALARAAATKVMRMGYYDDSGLFRGMGLRSTVMREWLGVEPWRYKTKTATLHPSTKAGERASLAGVGEWVQPKGSGAEDPASSLAMAITAYVMGVPQDEAHVAFVRDHVFSGDTFSGDGKVLAGTDDPAPVRTRRTAAVPLI